MPFRFLRARGTDVVVAASGGKDDPREPDYFDSIVRQIDERNLSGNFRYLGMIPLSHVYALLRVCTALINPSRFEGWSTTVEEAKSFGVPMILSDLDVHREQTAGMASYFGTDDPTALADHLIRAASNPESYSVRDLVPGLDARVSTFAADFRILFTSRWNRGEKFGGKFRGRMGDIRNADLRFVLCHIVTFTQFWHTASRIFPSARVNLLSAFHRNGAWSGSVSIRSSGPRLRLAEALG